MQFVVNPIAGRAGGRRGAAARRAVEVFRRRLEAAGVGVATGETEQAGDGGAIAARACREGVRAVVVVGGDGTVNEVVGGMGASGVPIVIVPAGTENVLAKHFGIRLEGEFLWRMLRDGVEARIDVAEVRAKTESGEEARRRFILMGGVGFDAAMVLGVTRRRSEFVRQGDGQISHRTYLSVAWELLRRFRHPRLRVEVDGEVVDLGQALVLVGNVRRYAMGLQPWGDARADDGLLEVSAFSCRNQCELVRHFAAVFFRPMRDRRGMVRLRGRRVRISSCEPAVPVQVDGDFAGWLPAEFSVTGGQARFMTPGGRWAGRSADQVLRA